MAVLSNRSSLLVPGALRATGYELPAKWYEECSIIVRMAEASLFTTKEADVGVAVEHQRVDAGRFQGQQWDESQDSVGRVSVGRVERVLSMVAGGMLTAYGLKRRSLQGGAAAMTGAALLYRGATGHCSVYGALGIDRANGHASGHGTGEIADRDSDTRHKLGGSRGNHTAESGRIHRPAA